MKKIKILQHKALLAELKLQHALKTLPKTLKKIFLVLLILFISSGFLLIYQLDKRLSIEVPTEGGTLIEGIIGIPRFINPALTISDTDRDLTMLVYSSLMRTENNQLIPDLAESYEISEGGLTYTFKLKPNLLWSDDTPLTSDDIIFTIETIKNPTVKSLKRANWEGVRIEKIDDRTIKFYLEKPYAPFLENTTLGILPLHIWGEILPEQMPLSNFNIKPIGSGPYKIEKVSRNASGIITSYTLTPNKNFALKKPYLQKIIFKFYPSENQLIKAYQKNEINSLSSISPKEIIEIKDKNSFLKTYHLSRIFAVFFNQDNSPLLAQQEVRKALDQSVDKKRIVSEVLQDFGVTINSPIPPGSIGYLEEDTEEKTHEEQIEGAQKLLKKNGWRLSPEEEAPTLAEGEDGVPTSPEANVGKQRVLEKKTKKGTTRLEFSVSTSNIPDLIQTANILKENWERLGAKVTIKIYEVGDLEQNVIRPRKYDMLLFGEIMGKDPDAFAFWHSSQRNDPGLNIALYANITVDKLLEEARETFNIKKRETKYFEFQKELKEDVPAIFLYSPYFIHLIPSVIENTKQEFITISSERFSQIYNWYTKTKKVWKIFQ